MRSIRHRLCGLRRQACATHRPLTLLIAAALATGASVRGAEFFIVQADGTGGAYPTVNGAIAAAIASPGGASGDTIEIRSNVPGTLQVYDQSIDLSQVAITSPNEADWLSIRVREGDQVRFRTTGNLLVATGNSSGWKIEGNSLGYESLQFGDRGDFDHSGTNTYRTCYPHNQGAAIASTCSNYAIRRAQFTGGRSYAANVFDGTDYELDGVAAFDHGTNHYDFNPNSGNPQDWGELAVVRGNRIRLLNLYGEHGGHNNWKFEGINMVVRNGDFTGYWGDISPSDGSRATLVESAGSAPAPYGPALMEGVVIRDSGASIDNSRQAAMKTEGNHIVIRDSFFFDVDSHIWHMNFANAKQPDTSYFSGHAFYHNTSYISKGTWWNNFQGYNSASGDAQFENNLIANNLFQQVEDNDRTTSPAQIFQFDTSPIGTNGFPNAFHGTVISGNAIGGPSVLKQVNLSAPSGNITFPIDAPPATPVDLTDNVYDNVITDVSFVDVGAARARTKQGFAVVNWGAGATAGDAPPLTTVTSDSSGTALTVANARPFFDGWGIRGEAGDYLYIGATATSAESAGPVQIANIDYTTHTITLTEPRVVVAGNGVWFGGNPANGGPAIRKDRGAHIPPADNNDGGNNGGNPGNNPGNGVRSGIYDVNTLKVSHKTSGDTIAVVTDSGALNGSYLTFQADSEGDAITLALTSAPRRTYEVHIRVLKGPSGGTFQLAIDNGGSYVDLGPPQDLYASHATFTDLALGVVTLNPGRRQFRFTVVGKNADSSGYELPLDTIRLTPTTGAPEINVTGNGLTIVSGDTTPQAADNTDFGEANIGTGVVLKEFTVENLGDATLTLGAVNVGGDFALYEAPPSSLAGGTSADFTLAFLPTEEGVRTSTVSFSNSDTNENPYTFAIAGTGEIANAGLEPVRVVDTFTDANGTLLSAHVPDVDEEGLGWSVLENNAVIMGDAVQLLGNDSAPPVIEAGVSDAVVTVDYIPVAGSRDGLVFRYIDRDNFLELNARQPNGDLRLLRTSGGGLSTLASTQVTWTPGAIHQLKVVLSGTTVTGYVNGVEMLTANVTDHQDGTAYGLQRRNGQDATRFDNFRVEVQ